MKKKGGALAGWEKAGNRLHFCIVWVLYSKSLRFMVVELMVNEHFCCCSWLDCFFSDFWLRFGVKV